MIRDAMVRSPSGYAAIREGSPRSATSKIVKIRLPGGSTTIFSSNRTNARRKLFQRISNSSAPATVKRSWLARLRGYYQGPTGTRGTGRNTGIVSPISPSARGDVLKLQARGRLSPVGRFLPKIGG